MAYAGGQGGGYGYGRGNGYGMRGGYAGGRWNPIPNFVPGAMQPGLPRPNNPFAQQRGGEPAFQPGQPAMPAGNPVYAPFPHARVVGGDQSFLNHPGFAAAAAQPPLFDLEDEYASQAAAQDMTHSDTVRRHAENDRQRLLALPQRPGDVDMQGSKGKILAGKSVYVIAKIIVPGGDKRRMSDGIFLVKHPSGDFRVAKALKVQSPAQIERVRVERAILKKLSKENSAHINYMYDVSISPATILS